MVMVFERQYGADMLNGSCACGQVRYTIRGPLIGPVTYCHCCEIHDALPQDTRGVLLGERRLVG